jgi:hypothetical protein
LAKTLIIPGSGSPPASATGGAVANTVVQTAGSGTTGAVDTGKADLPKAARRPRGLSVDHGRATLKGYPVTEDDLENLGWLDGAAAFAFAVATGLLSQWFDITKDIALATDAPAPKVAFYKGVSVMELLVGLVLLLLCIPIIWFRHSKIKKIKDRTTFGA